MSFQALLWLAIIIACAAGCNVAVPANVLPPEIPATRATSRRVLLGNSVEGRPLEMVIFGEPCPECPPILIIGGIHGDETTSVVVANHLIDDLTQNPAEAAGHIVAILPNANPDGRIAGTRTNAHGVDLNRNFPSQNWSPKHSVLAKPGKTAGSEPETQAVLQAIQMVAPSRIISIHSFVGRCLDNYDGPARDLAETMSRFNHYPVAATIGYPTPGSLGSWAGVDRQVPTITLELPYNLPGEDAWKQNRAALLAAIGADGP